MSNEIVLVGNGPSLLRKTLGSKIDSFPQIVRFNSYQTEGFRKHVGSRTTIWSRWYGLKITRPMHELEKIWINMPTHERTSEKTEIAFAIIGRYSDRAIVVPKSNVAQQLQSLVYGHLDGSKWPSSGLLAIANAIDIGHQVYLAGFDSWSTEPFHYYEVHDRSDSHHVPNIEREYIESLVSEGLVSHL